MRGPAYRLGLLHWPAYDADDVAGLLDGERAGARHVVGGRTNGGTDLVGGEQSAWTRQRAKQGPNHGGGAAHLEQKRMSHLLQENFISRPAVHGEGHLI